MELKRRRLQERLAVTASADTGPREAEAVPRISHFVPQKSSKTSLSLLPTAQRSRLESKEEADTLLDAYGMTREMNGTASMTAGSVSAETVTSNGARKALSQKISDFESMMSAFEHAKVPDAPQTALAAVGVERMAVDDLLVDKALRWGIDIESGFDISPLLKAADYRLPGDLSVFIVNISCCV